MIEIFAIIANFSPDVIETAGSCVVVIVIVVVRSKWVIERLTLENLGACTAV